MTEKKLHKINIKSLIRVSSAFRKPNLQFPSKAHETQSFRSQFMIRLDMHCEIFIPQLNLTHFGPKLSSATLNILIKFHGRWI